MATENYDGYSHVHNLQEKALKEDTTEEELKEVYAAWSKTYEKVRSLFRTRFFSFENGS
jgi:hemoglobin-like flavoprotein